MRLLFSIINLAFYCILGFYYFDNNIAKAVTVVGTIITSVIIYKKPLTVFSLFYNLPFVGIAALIQG